jgi:acyl carrier protein
LELVLEALEQASGLSLEKANLAAPFAELGIDSLSLSQCAKRVTKRLGSEVSLRQLSEELTSPGKLVDFVESKLAEKSDERPTRPTGMAASSGDAPSHVSHSAPNAPGAATPSEAAPPMPGARLGRDRHGNPAWYVPHPEIPGKYVLYSREAAS